MEFKVDVPGSYKIVDHSILRAFNKGALGELKVEGPENKAIYSGKQVESEYKRRNPLASTRRHAMPIKRPCHGGDLGTSRCRGDALQDLLHGVPSGRRTGTARNISAACEVGLLDGRQVTHDRSRLQRSDGSH